MHKIVIEGDKTEMLHICLKYADKFFNLNKIKYILFFFLRIP